MPREKGIQEIFGTQDAAVNRCKELRAKGDRTAVVIISSHEPDKFFVENNAPFVRMYERIVYPVNP